MEPSKNLNYKIQAKAVQSDLGSLFFMERGHSHNELERNWRVSIDIISQDIYTFLDVLKFLRFT